MAENIAMKKHDSVWVWVAYWGPTVFYISDRVCTPNSGQNLLFHIFCKFSFDFVGLTKE